MTPKVHVDLSRAQRCAKPNCNRPGPFHRHHIRHKKYWINRFDDGGVVLGSVRLILPDEFVAALRVRYEKFLDRDIVLLCSWHHCEIHRHYTWIIQDLVMRHRLLGKAIRIRDVVLTLRRCKSTCKRWLSLITPGLNPKRHGWVDD